MDAARRSERERVGWVARWAERVLVELVHRWSRWSERRIVVSVYTVLTVISVQPISVQPISVQPVSVQPISILPILTIALLTIYPGALHQTRIKTIASQLSILRRAYPDPCVKLIQVFTCSTVVFILHKHHSSSAANKEWT